jgi:integrase
MKTEGRRKPRLDAAALARLNAVQAETSAIDEASLLGLIRAWRPRSPEWKKLAVSTQKTWGAALDLIEAKWSHTPLYVWSDPRIVRKVVDWRDSRSDTPRAADVGISVLRALLEFGRLRGQVTINVATRIPQLYANGSRSEIVWTDEEIALFVAEATRTGALGVADGMRIAALTGLRRAGLVTLTWDQVTDVAIVKKALISSRGKRRFATIPRIPELDDLLSELRTRPRQADTNTVLVNSYGRGWTGDGFGGSFNRVRDALNIVHTDPETGATKKKHLHDVRGTFCTKLLEHEVPDAQVAEIMGWSPAQVAGIKRTYVDQSKVIVEIGRRMRG